MTIAVVVKNRIRYPHNGANAKAIKTCLDALVAAVNAGAQVVNSISADTDGRAMMQALYFNAATVAAKFDAASFAANATIRALFADDLLDAATVARVVDAKAITAASIADATITCAQLAATLRGEPQALTGAGAVNLTTAVTLFTSDGPANALTLADGTIAGQRKRIIHVVDGGAGVLTAGASLHLGASIASITLAAARDWVDLDWSVTGTVWNVVAFSGCTFT